MPCSYCGFEKVAAKGLCVRCYCRMRSTGSPEYKRKGRSPLLCSVDGCEKIVHAQGLCNNHYMTTKRHGDVVSPFGYGERRKHPLYESWVYQGRIKLGREDAWADFWKFVDDVGEKPAGKHWLTRIDVQRPWGPDNFIWAARKGSTTHRSAYVKAWRDENLGKVKNTELKRNFGITLDDYMRMYTEQNGVCAICGRKGEPVGTRKTTKDTLVVDHCHVQGGVRGLLCSYCNLGLGYFFDGTDILRKAAQYVESRQFLPSIG